MVHSTLESWMVVLASALVGAALAVLIFRRWSPPPTASVPPPDNDLLNALNRCGIGHVHIDTDGHIVALNDAMANLMGRATGAMMGAKITSLFVDHEHPDSGRFITDQVFAPPYDINHNYALTALGADDKRFPVEIWYGGQSPEPGAQTEWLICDVSATQELKRLRLSEERYKSSRTFANIGTWDWVIRTDELHWSEEVAPMFGLPHGSSFTYSQFCEAVHPDDRAHVKENEDACIENKQKHDVEYRVIWPDGTERWLRETGNLLRDEHGHPVRMIGVVRDITDQKEAEQRYRHMAYHDPLTGLPNRGLFEQRLDLAVQRATRNNASTALLYMDLGKFKWINDNHGHSIGDGVLVEVGSRLKTTVRGTDTVARIGGDEFILILENMKSEVEAENLARKVIDTLNAPMEIQGRELRIDVSIGISICPQHAATATQLIHQADMAMYEAKKAGRNEIRTA